MPSPSSRTSIPFTSPEWRPLDPSHPLLSPGEPKPTDTRLGTITQGGTDWWRAPPDVDRRTGPALGFWRDGAAFEVSVDIRLEPRVQVGQSGSERVGSGRSGCDGAGLWCGERPMALDARLVDRHDSGSGSGAKRQWACSPSSTYLVLPRSQQELRSIPSRV